MLLPSIISLLVVPLLASPLLPEGAEADHHHKDVAEERQFEAVADILASDTDTEYLDEDVDSRLLTSGTAGDYTLVSIPWTKNTALSFNDTTASTLSTLGNAALLVGGLYLLSGFQGSALADPFGISRRFGQPAPLLEAGGHNIRGRPQPQRKKVKK